MDEFIKTLLSLVRNDALSKADALAMFRSEFKCGFMYCVNIGLVAAIDREIVDRTVKRKTAS